MKLALATITLLFAISISLINAHADDPSNPWLCKGMLCKPAQQCPKPEPAPNCNQSKKTKCEAVKRPNFYGCDPGTASACVESQPGDQCQSSGFANECGAAECAYCQWDDDLNKCIMVGECTMGPCNQPCS